MSSRHPPNGHTSTSRVIKKENTAGGEAFDEEEFGVVDEWEEIVNFVTENKTSLQLSKYTREVYT